MGKAKKQRRKPHKENPTGLLSVRDFETLEAENEVDKDRQTALQTVYEEVESGNVEEKLSGLQTLESMSCDSTLAVQIAKDGIAKMIGALLIDPNVILRSNSASVLRRIADNGKTDAHENLLNDDIMTPLCASLENYYRNWQPRNNRLEKSNDKDEEEAFIQTVTLLWTLCEHNESTIKHVNEADLVAILTKFFDISTYGIEIATVIANCLLSLSENNAAAINKLQSCENTIFQLLNLEAKNDNIAEIVCLKTALSGLVLNLINSTDNNSITKICKVINILSDTLSIDHKEILSDLISILPHEKNAFSSVAKKKVEKSRKMLAVQQLGLEVLANLCSGNQEEDIDDSDINDWEFESSDCKVDGIDVSMDDGSMYKSCNKIVVSLPLEIVEGISSCNIVEKVWKKSIAVDKDMVEIFEQNDEGEAVLKQMHTINCRAYLCLNNLISSLDIDAVGGVENVYRMWSSIGTFVFKDANPNDGELLEAATAAMRAALERLSATKINVFNKLTLNDIQPMLNGERQCQDPNIRVNLLQILGHLALVLINNNSIESRELIKHISMFLLDTCTNESKAWVIAECLDAIMDIYAEDDTDDIANEIELSRKLRAVVPLFKDKVRQERRTLGDNVAVVSTVNTNIMRFIKYKEKRRHI